MDQPSVPGSFDSIPIWLSAAATLVAAFAGAWMAFLLEGRRRQRLEFDRRAAAANSALLTIANLWDILTDYEDQCVDLVKDDPGWWMNLPATLPLSLTSIDLKELMYVLQAKDGGVLYAIMLEEHRFAQLLRAIELHSHLFATKVRPRGDAARIAFNTRMTRDEVVSVLGVGLVEDLENLTRTIIADVRANRESLEAAFTRLRAAVKSLHPNVKLVDGQFSKTPGGRHV